MKTLAKTLISSLTPALLLGLSGCTIHVHGSSETEAGGGSRSAGGEHARSKPKPERKKDDRKVVHATKPDPKKPDPKKPDPKPETQPKPAPAGHGGGSTGIDTGKVVGGGKVSPADDSKKPDRVANIDAGGALAGGSTQNTPIDTGKVIGGGKVTVTEDGKKPDATGSIDVNGTLAKPDAPIDPSKGIGVVTFNPAKPEKIDTASGIGGKVTIKPSRSAQSIAAEKVAEEGKRERGDRDLPEGSVGKDGEKKVTKPQAGTKDKGSNDKPAVLDTPKPTSAKAESAKAEGKGLSSISLVPGGGTLAMASVSCKLSSKELKQGSKLRLKGRGFVDGVKLNIGGVAVPVTAVKPTQIEAQLPADLAQGGAVAIKQGDDVVKCGLLTITAK